MTTQIEARRLSGDDRGKHVALQVEGGRHTGPWQLEGELRAVSHFADGTITIVVTREDGPAMGTGIKPDTQVMITGRTP